MNKAEEFYRKTHNLRDGIMLSNKAIEEIRTIEAYHESRVNESIGQYMNELLNKLKKLPNITIDDVNHLTDDVNHLTKQINWIASGQRDIYNVDYTYFESFDGWKDKLKRLSE